MQQFKLITRVGTPFLRSLFRRHAISSLALNPLAPFTTSIWHHSRETSMFQQPPCHVLACTGHVLQCTNHFHTTPSSRADDQPQHPDSSGNDRKIYVLWAKFATLIQNFTAGVKSLYSDVKLMSEYKQRHGNLQIQKSAPSMTEDGKMDLLYSREELQFMYRVHNNSYGESQTQVMWAF